MTENVAGSRGFGFTSALFITPPKLNSTGEAADMDKARDFSIAAFDTEDYVPFSGGQEGSQGEAQILDNSVESTIF